MRKRVRAFDNRAQAFHPFCYRFQRRALDLAMAGETFVSLDLDQNQARVLQRLLRRPQRFDERA